MKHSNLIYDLSVTDDGNQLQLTVPARLHSKVSEAMETQLQLKDEGVPFINPSLAYDRFGINSCGQVDKVDNTEERILILPMTTNCAGDVIETLSILLCALNSLSWDNEAGVTNSNQKQLLELSTSAHQDSEHMFYIVEGQIYTHMGRWVCRKGSELEGYPKDLVIDLPFVTEKMEEVWKKITDDDMTKHHDQCEAFVVKDGKFSLSVYGDNCNVSIYAHQLRGMGPAGTTTGFGCNNVESPKQALTLIAGLAAMCDLVREEE